MEMTGDLAAFEASAAQAARLLKALSNERRLLILCQIGDGERSVGSLQVGLSQSALSQHLALLRAEGLVSTRRDAQTIYYRIADPAVLQLIATLAAIYCPPTPLAPA
ncbi:ArsR family transcriptional regulator [Sandarakinorhabdus cyanobacteriorum]|uniref:ArsR family transcriptional regulator n=2 Tax=Sandarakinorhabdus cyanobacteriorum TaxID=1981098 RepID=A0A255Y319_9SPHN|nr:metalloregulator ArsR/SmtB family transcription factor [Sandarakinorhabdus cyanobacteriorum]OYQ23659.1 ArsR family transcriptional regulator [Sandarakinorhabdus cyanobacteriorum]